MDRACGCGGRSTHFYRRERRRRRSACFGSSHDQDGSRRRDVACIACARRNARLLDMAGLHHLPKLQAATARPSGARPVLQAENRGRPTRAADHEKRAALYDRKSSVTSSGTKAWLKSRLKVGVLRSTNRRYFDNAASSHSKGSSVQEPEFSTEISFHTRRRPHVQRHLISAHTRRALRAVAMSTWRTAIAAA